MQRTKLNRALRVFLLAGGASLSLFLVTQVFKIPCPILHFTGFYCGGCGGSRMISAILRGDIAGAFRSNALLMLLSPPAIVYLILEGYRYILLKPPLYRKKWVLICLIIAAVLTAAFTLLRNLPPFYWLRPV